MTDYEKRVIRDIAFTVRLNDFKMVTVQEFNERHSYGNPILGDDDEVMWFYHRGPFTVTICKCGMVYCCEVTNDKKHETGLFQHVAEAPDIAWYVTNNDMMMI